MSKLQEIMFNGPDGKLEGKFVASDIMHAPAALCLHPHPLHGGTMNNKVIYNSFYALAEIGFSALRFNFPGCGKSQGSFDNGVGELSSAAYALDLLQEYVPEASGYWLVGFSFGAWIAAQLLMRRPEISGFIAIAPPAHSYDFNFLAPCPAQGLIIQGTHDRVVPEEAVFSLYEKLCKQKTAKFDDKQKGTKFEYVAISGADHFFKDQMEELKKTISTYMQPKIADEPTPIKLKRDRRRRNSQNQPNVEES